MVGSVAVAIAVANAGLVACSDSTEGERCEVLNGNDDCSVGLVCLRKEDVNAPYKNGDRCCPPDRRSASHPACVLLQNPIAGDSAPPPDTGPTVTTDASDASDANAASDAPDGG